MDISITQVVVIKTLFSFFSFLGLFLCWKQDRWVFGLALLLGGVVFVMLRFHSLEFWQEFGGHKFGAHIIDALWVEGSEPMPTWWGRDLYPTESWSDWIAWTSAAAGAIVVWTILLLQLSMNGPNGFLRGASIIQPDRMQKRLAKKGGRHPVMIGNMPLPGNLETRSVALVGEPGTGKTQIILGMLSAISKRYDRVVAIDVGAEIYHSFGREGDNILSVSTQETEFWSPFAEISCASDCRMIAYSLIPAGEKGHAEWNDYTRGLLTVIIEVCWRKGLRTNHDLIYFSQSAPVSELKEMLSGTSAQRLFEPGSEKMLSNVLSILSTYLAPLQHLNPDAGEDGFSLRSWLTDDYYRGWLWIIYDDSTGAATASLRAAWIEILTRSALSLEACDRRRIWFFLDELSSHGKIEILSQALARGRKYGLSLVLGIQNISQLFSIYGRDEAHSILGSVGHMAILRTPDADTADYLSRTIGDAEVTRKQQSKNEKTVSHTEVRETKPVVLSSEISQLPDRAGFLKIAGFGWTRIKVPLTRIIGKLSLTEKFPRKSQDSFSIKNANHEAFKEKITTPDNNLDDL